VTLGVVALMAGAPAGASSSSTRTATARAAPLPTRWVFLGDSVAGTLESALQAEAARHGVSVRMKARSGCGMVTVPNITRTGALVPWSVNCGQTNPAFQAQAVAGQQVALWLSTWEAGNHLFHGTVLDIGTRAGDMTMVGELESAVARITAGGARLVFLTDPPPAVHSDKYVADPYQVLHARLLNRLLRLVAMRNPDRVSVVDLAAMVCPGSPPCPEFVDGVRLRPRDGAHFEGAGPAWVAPRLFTAIANELEHPTRPFSHRFFRLARTRPR
jgi:SGNH domain-containing protein